MGKVFRTIVCAMTAIVGLSDVSRNVHAQTKQPGATPPSTSQPAETQSGHPLLPAIAMARKSLEKVRTIQDYEGTLTKRELIGQTLTTQMMQIRVRQEPLAVYMKYTAPNEGREVLFDASQDPGKLLVHEGAGIKSLAGTLALPLNDPQVMAETRHVVTDLGIERLIELVIEQWESESKFGEIDVKYYPNAKMGRIECEVLEATHPRPRRQFKYHQTRLFLEKKTNLPLRVQNFGFPQKAGLEPPLVEDFAYTGLKTNVGLKPIDFSKTNQNYRFQ